MAGLTYDSGALIAAERRDRRVWQLHTGALARGTPPVVPAAALAQAWRGGPQAELARFLRDCWIEPLSESLAREAGAALTRSRTTDVPDAAVVVCAMQRLDTVVTSDRADIERIARALNWRVNVIDV